MGKMQDFQANPYQYWLRHPDGQFLLGRGGQTTIPPLYANVSLTNRCNLRCTICHSQTDLDISRTPRSDMSLEVFHRIRDQLFPLLLVVELNSAGEPLLYPHFDDVLQSLIDHDCEVWLQTNGTLFTPRNIERLRGLGGRIALSIDAVGPLFEELRCNGEWAKVDAGVSRLMSHPQPAQSVIITATVSERSAPGMLDVVRWAADKGIHHVDFHDYRPIHAGPERVPSPDLVLRESDRVVAWCQANASGTMVSVNEVVVYRPRDYQMMPSRLAYVYHPMAADAPGANAQVLCQAPYLALDIGVSGDIAPCCAAQGHPLGYVGDARALADLWFGDNLRNIRFNMRRDGQGGFPYSICNSCVATRLPAAGRDGRPVAVPLSCQWDEVPLSGIKCGGTPDIFRARVPAGFSAQDYILYQGETVVADWSVTSEFEVTIRGHYQLPHIFRRKGVQSRLA